MALSKEFLEAPQLFYHNCGRNCEECKIFTDKATRFAKDRGLGHKTHDDCVSICPACADDQRVMDFLRYMELNPRLRPYFVVRILRQMEDIKRQIRENKRQTLVHEALMCPDCERNDNRQCSKGCCCICLQKHQRLLTLYEELNSLERKLLNFEP